MMTTSGIAAKRGRPKKVELKYDVKPKKRRISKEAKLHGERVAWGPEPTWDDQKLKTFDYETHLGYALNWYSQTCLDATMKKYTLEYLKSVNTPSDVMSKLLNLPDRLFTTLGSVARCATRGAKLAPNHKAFISSRVKELIREFSPAAEEVHRVPLCVPRRQLDSMQRKLLEQIEYVTDEYLETRDTDVLADFDFAHVIRNVGADASQVRGVLKLIDPRLQELQGSLSGDKELKEAYSHMKKSEVSVLIAFYKTILPQGIEVAPKKPRKQRTKKPQTAEKILRKFQHLPEWKDGSFKVVSIDPKDVLGADELWVFNTKTRKLGFFKAAEEQKLTVKGTTILNFDEEASFAKKLRKPAEQLAQVKTLSKPATKKYVATIRAKEATLKGRINNETILIRAF